MSGNRRPPQARDRVLGAQLRALRLSHTALGLEEAARAAQVSPATMSRTENGKRHITAEDVAVLCTLYGVSSVQRSALVEATSAPSRAGWWERLLPGGVPVNAGTLASYESVASVITDWSLAVVPGLVQTRAYALGVLAAQGIRAAAAEELWEMRRRRQQVLRAVEYTAYVHEVALRTPYGGVDALREQLAGLRRAPDRGVGVRVVRAGAALGALAHSWMMLEFAKDEPIVHVELMNSAVYLHVPMVDAYQAARRELARASLPTEESLKLIDRLAGRL